MEYVVSIRPAPSAADAARDAVTGSDPAAVVDTDAHTGELRIATSLGLDELRSALDGAGLEVEAGDIVAKPSNCCGGCGG